MRKSKKTKQVKCQVIPELTPQDRTIAEFYESGMSKPAIQYWLRVKEARINNTLQNPAVKKYLQEIRLDNQKRCERILNVLTRQMERRLKKGKITITKQYDKKGKLVTKTIKKESYGPKDLIEMAKLAGRYTPNMVVNQQVNNINNTEMVSDALIKQLRMLKGA